MTEIKGWHVLGMFVLGFGVIIAVNATLAVNAVRSFPGLETDNSYVTSQEFQAQRSGARGAWLGCIGAARKAMACWSW